MTVNTSDLLDMYKKMALIRVSEETLISLFEKAEMPGFIHSYLGEEATGVGICHALEKNDIITSTHRGHGHVIAKGADLNLFFAELYGKKQGYCKGKGGSMHVADFDLGILGANGIVGGGIPIAAGAALASKIKGENKVSVTFFGDGATDTGSFHESLNLAATWDLPVVFIAENNGFADFIRQSDHQKIEKISIRAEAYGMPGVTVDGNDVEAVNEAAHTAVGRAREGKGPTLIECVTYRWRGHYEGDPQPYRSQEEVEEWKKRDPLLAAANKLRDRGEVDDDSLKAIDEEIRDTVQKAIDFAKGADDPVPQSALEDVYSDLVVEDWQ